MTAREERSVMQSKGYVDSHYLEATAELLQPIKDHSYRLMHIQEENTVLDVGSGAGIDTVALAGYVGPTGRVLGVDYDAAMVAAANERANRQGVSAFVEHRQGSATALPIETATVDACRCERVFMHLTDAAKALNEMVRVMKPGGRIVVVEPDWGTSSIDTSEVDIERRLMRARAELMMQNGYSGRQLYRLFKQTGLSSISIEIFPIYFTDYALNCSTERLGAVEQGAVDANIISRKELERWRSSLEQADKDGVFFSSTCVITVQGQKA